MSKTHDYAKAGTEAHRRMQRFLERRQKLEAILTRAVNPVFHRSNVPASTCLDIRDAILGALIAYDDFIQAETENHVQN